MVRMLSMMINEPTRIIKDLRGSFFVIGVERGAAMTPPISRPKMICQYWEKLKASTKVTDSAKVMKNSEKLTEPIVMRGYLPRATSVDVTTGPQPPPPIASKNPPNRPSQLMFGP